jgi:ornithine cyclodeaminase/alanine dehydrogenase-like protein (mu-crystallin family)
MSQISAVRGAGNAEAGDLLQPIAARNWSADGVCGDLHELTADAELGRLDRNAITLFKLVGAPIEDLAAASRLLNAANPSSYARPSERGGAATKA